MKFTINGAVLRQGVGLALIAVVPAIAFAQHKTSAPAPAAHASAPAHNAAPAHSAPTHSGGSSQHAATTSHSSNMHTNTSSHVNTAGHGTTMAGHTSTAGGHGSTAAGHGTMNAGHGANTAGHGAMGGGHNATMAGHGGGMSGGHGNVGHGNVAHGNVGHGAPGRQVSLRGGGSAHIRPNGQIRSVNRNGMHIEHNMHGGRTIVREHNGARIVSTGRRGGYVQRAYVTRGGRSYYSRTYYYHGGYRSGVYRGYNWHGHPYYGYSHPYFYHPGYYGWAYNPWPAPVAYGWGWGGAPWYGYYGGYFAPYPVYPSAAFWLTDYLISANLQAAYAARAEADAEAGGDANNSGPAPSDQIASNGQPAAAPSSQVALSPEVKQAIAEQVKAQIAAAQSEAGKTASSAGGQQPAGDEVPPALNPAQRTFIVSDDLAVVADGQECSLTQGDVITRLTDTPDDDQKVNVSVASSKKTDCAAGKMVAVAVDDLQEMHNHFQEQIDEGMKALAAKQGTGGLPKAPDTSTVASDVPAPPPDKNAAKTLEDQNSEADKAESEVKQEAASSGGGSQ